MRPRMPRRVRFVAAMIAGLAAIALFSAGCSRLGGGENDLKDVTDLSGLFHFKVPADWQYTTDEGLIVVYAAEELPRDANEIDTLAIFVFTTTQTTDTPVPEELTRIVEARAQSRGWTGYEIGEPENATLGGRPASTLVVNGTDGNGRGFDARFYLARQPRGEFGIMAVAPAGTLGEYEGELSRITGEDWFWHFDEGGSNAVSPESTATSAP